MELMSLQPPLRQAVARSADNHSVSIDPEYTTSIVAQGDAMAPTILDGALVLVDTRQRTFINRCIFAVMPKDSRDIILGRADIRALPDDHGHHVRLIYDNPKYFAKIVPQRSWLNILGRVTLVAQGL